MEREGFSFNLSEVGVFDGNFDLEETCKARLSDELINMLRCGVCFDLFSDHHLRFHGTKVAILITGDPPVGMRSRGVITRLEPTSRCSSKSSGVLSRTLFDLPIIVSFSVQSPLEAEDFHNMTEYAERADRILDQTILVQAGGNSFPEEVEPLIAERGEPFS